VIAGRSRHIANMAARGNLDNVSGITAIPVKPIIVVDCKIQGIVNFHEAVGVAHESFAIMLCNCNYLENMPRVLPIPTPYPFHP